ncbi:MAG: hypothetical protein KA248_09305 [Kiritimatiellae bacterium]|nr:hypothetical protein [Kiritimatiellia bacterium]
MIPRWFIPVLLVSLAAVVRGENLLKNPGFEEGGYWASYLYAYPRNEWRSHDDGRYNAAIMGLWAGKGPLSVIDRKIWADQSPDGMIEQRDIPIAPGRSYVFRAWLWADPGWAPVQQYMKIIFYDREGFILGERSIDLPTIYPMWTAYECAAAAPAGAVKASVAIGARGVRLYGAMTIDDLYFGE